MGLQTGPRHWAKTGKSRLTWWSLTNDALRSHLDAYCNWRKCYLRHLQRPLDDGLLTSERAHAIFGSPERIPFIMEASAGIFTGLLAICLSYSCSCFLCQKKSGRSFTMSFIHVAMTWHTGIIYIVLKKELTSMLREYISMPSGEVAIMTLSINWLQL